MRKTHKLLNNYYILNENQQNETKLIVGAAANGSILHQMLLSNQLSMSEFSAGLAFVKLHALAMRSKGIKNRMRTYCQNWENLAGIAHDNFCSLKLESLWNTLVNILMQKIAYKQLLWSLVMPNNNFNYPILQTKAALAFLSDFWQACEKTIYGKQAKKLLQTEGLKDRVKV
jgi:hypothetical protein